MQSVSADFCSDVRLALALSAKFADLRGTVNNDGTWMSDLTIMGARGCVISQSKDGRYNLICSFNEHISSEIEADNELLALTTKLKYCLPEPKFSYRTVAIDNMTKIIISSNNKTLACLSLVSRSADLGTNFNYTVGMTVVGQ